MWQKMISPFIKVIKGGKGDFLRNFVRTYLKKKNFVPDQGEAKDQPAGIR